MGKSSKKKFNFKRIIKTIIIAFFLVMIIIMSVFLIVKFYKEEPKPLPRYISSIDKEVPLYDYEYNEVFKLYRGTLINSYDNDITNNDINYKEVIYDENKYLIKEEDLVEDYNDVIKETKLFVRTPVTVYQNEKDSKILGFIFKGNEIKIVGFDKINKGIVNMYKIEYEDTTGYIYSKYLVDTKDKALANYNENNTYNIHKDRSFYYNLYGGSPKKLDYYPYEKPSFTDNKLIEDARTLYLNGSDGVLKNIDSYIKLAKESNINAFVVDIKDGYLSYKSEVAKSYSMKAYNSSSRSIDDYKSIISKLIDNGFYVIGRIVAFNDSHFAYDNPNEAIKENGKATSWTSAYSRVAWEYNVMLAKEAIELFKFNEIQFDYVRFPEDSYSMSISNSYNFNNKYKEEKSEAIQNFIFYATDQIHESGAYISIDVFGESANDYVTAYGQYWPAISNIVDVISAMPYPDHFNRYDYGFTKAVWTIPYELLCAWGSSASKRQKEIPTPALVRTWIQAFDTYYDPSVIYDADMVSKQIKALYDSGLVNGYITWNAGSSLEKYKSISGAFKKEYR